jgi:hypothetical protein
MSVLRRTVRFGQITRFQNVGEPERISFKPGVNLLVGAPNSGKSVWLQMLDFMLGDHISFGKRFSHEIEYKYSRIEAEVWINDQPHVMNRLCWPSAENASAMIDGRSVGARGIQRFIEKSLGIPQLFFPRGLGTRRQWNELSWRMLMRHVYRQQRFWGDIADRLYADENTAVVLQFLGVAKDVFPQSKAQAKRLEHSTPHDSQVTSALTSLVMSLASEWTDGLNDEHSVIGSIVSQIETISGRSNELRDIGRSLKHQTPRDGEDLLRMAFERGKLVERKRALAALLKISRAILVDSRPLGNGDQEVLPDSVFSSSTAIRELIAERGLLLKFAINHYLQRVNEIRPGTWKRPAVELDVFGGNISFRIGGVAWNKALGGTEALYFLTAYHFGLMSLSPEDGCHYPGITIIDLPSEFLGELSEMRGKAIIQPFVELLDQPGFSGCQAIFAGRCLPELRGAVVHML